MFLSHVDHYTTLLGSNALTGRRTVGARVHCTIYGRKIRTRALAVRHALSSAHSMDLIGGIGDSRSIPGVKRGDKPRGKLMDYLNNPLPLSLIHI